MEQKLKNIITELSKKDLPGVQKKQVKKILRKIKIDEISKKSE